MIGKLRENLAIGNGHNTSYNRCYPRSKEYEITDSELHPIWGQRYQVCGYPEWLEANCFEYVKGEVNKRGEMS